MDKEYFDDLISELRIRRLSKDQIAKLKRRLAKKYQLSSFPTDIEIFLNARPEDVKYLGQLQTKPTRSLSGVAVVAVMTKPMPCPHGKCAICPGGPDSAFGEVPQSYTGKEPATMRAIRAGFDPYLQVFNRLEQYIVTGHAPDKAELIIMGGTFPSFPEKYQDDFVKYCFKAMNDFSRLFFRKGELDIIAFKDFFGLPGRVGDPKRTKNIQNKLRKLKGETMLEKEQKLNEKAKIRCIGMTIETRPDYAKEEHAEQMLRLGCTRVELGVQSVYDDILDGIERGHSVRDSIDATRTLKDLGFKINYHYMLGLPGSNETRDLVGLQRLFVDPRFRPDMLKIYPCMVVKGTKLHDEWKRKKFFPLSTKDAAEIIIEFKKTCPEYVRIMRVQRDIPTYATEAGVDRTNLRQLIQEEMRKRGIKCRCIRCREIGRLAGKGRTRIKTLNYDASEGKEFFISAVKGDSLLGFCRLRFPSQSLRKEITKDSALIRELHVYGKAVSVGKKGAVQHTGIGKRLLKEAENIAKRNGRKKIVVISGIGAREYYRKLGYRLEGVYMVRKP
ncbi:MAG TPA: tRNA uridine(34) 5-carboxymethylaminomethyl modification radical SAM/GNAT enzyme Elp3 [Candidatus Nanoarchaeia archaeon]|nr:tRNA uridine(34) 5-carboxymethylaminomethyl modification radical SAM/GNAT enzyme Elp3 [Candidatus Nanoarchaeia archaeon]